MKLTEKVSFIRGLMEGMEYPKDQKEGKIITAIVDVLEEMAQQVQMLEKDTDYLLDEMDEVKQQTSTLADIILDDYEEEIEDTLQEQEDALLTEDSLYEITCPKCGEVVCVDDDMLSDENLSCPNCHTSFEVDFDLDENQSVEE